jgi:hypothetical protein
MSAKKLAEHFSELEDPRCSGKGNSGVSKNSAACRNLEPTPLMLFKCTKILQEFLPVESVTSEAALLNQLWHGECS